MPGTTAPRLWMGIKLHPGYGLVTLLYLGGIYWLSSLPEVGGGRHDPLVQLASNLLHIPLFAGVTFCLWQALSGGQLNQEVPWVVSALTVLGGGASAALDEWHQAYVPGRYGSMSDFLLDLIGIGGMLLILRRLGGHSAILRQQHRPRD